MFCYSQRSAYMAMHSELVSCNALLYFCRTASIIEAMSITLKDSFCCSLTVLITHCSLQCCYLDTTDIWCKNEILQWTFVGWTLLCFNCWCLKLLNKCFRDFCLENSVIVHHCYLNQHKNMALLTQM